MPSARRTKAGGRRARHRRQAPAGKARCASRGESQRGSAGRNACGRARQSQRRKAAQAQRTCPAESSALPKNRRDRLAAGAATRRQADPAGPHSARRRDRSSGAGRLFGRDGDFRQDAVEIPHAVGDERIAVDHQPDGAGQAAGNSYEDWPTAAARAASLRRVASAAGPTFSTNRVLMSGICFSRQQAGRKAALSGVVLFRSTWARGRNLYPAAVRAAQAAAYKARWPAGDPVSKRGEPAKARMPCGGGSVEARPGPGCSVCSEAPAARCRL